MTGISGIKFLDLQNDVFNKEKWVFYGLTRKDNEFETKIFGDNIQELTDLLQHDLHNQVGYIVYNYEYMSPVDKIQRSKRLFIMWAPSNSSIKDRMKITMYAKNAQKILALGVSFHVCMQANSIEDVSESLILDKIKQNSTVF